jgi:hypothetical protein
MSRVNFARQCYIDHSFGTGTKVSEIDPGSVFHHIAFHRSVFRHLVPGTRFVTYKYGSSTILMATKTASISQAICLLSRSGKVLTRGALEAQQVIAIVRLTARRSGKATPVLVHAD